MKKTKEMNNKGITLIALVITIIVMLILVGVTITMAVNGGLFEQAGRAAQQTNEAIALEKQLSTGDIIDEVLGEVKEPLAGTWKFNGGEEVIYGGSGDKWFPVTFEMNSSEYIGIFVQDLGNGSGVVGFNQNSTSSVESTYARPHTGNPKATWSSNLSITITNTYDESIHADLLTFLRANATKVN